MRPTCQADAMTSAADVLVVDDDPQVREALTRALQLDGYAVATASNGAQALEAVGNCRPDLMVLDVMMPYVGGLDVCRTLRQRRGKATRPLAPPPAGGGG